MSPHRWNSPVPSNLTSAEALAVAFRVQHNSDACFLWLHPPHSPHGSVCSSNTGLPPVPLTCHAHPFLLRCFSAGKIELAELVASSSSGLCSNVHRSGLPDHLKSQPHRRHHPRVVLISVPFPAWLRSRAFITFWHTIQFICSRSSSPTRMCFCFVFLLLLFCFPLA